jgi:hypothetical protein
MTRFIPTVLTTVALFTTIALPAVALNEQFSAEHEQTMSKLNDCFAKEREQTMNKLNDRFKEPFETNLNK